MIYGIVASAVHEKEELKNESWSHHVIENKHAKISARGDPIISMKIKDLFLLTHDVYEKKWT